MRSLLAVALFVLPSFLHAAPLRVGVFEADVTPPIGTPLCDALVGPAKEIVDPLAARGIVLLGEGEPIVLVALDWVGIGNWGMMLFAMRSPRRQRRNASEFPSIACIRMTHPVATSVRMRF
ncbi:MAG: hypothetical protein U0744_05685 [Gemmataceae bacterium]